MIVGNLAGYEVLLLKIVYLHIMYEVLHPMFS